MRAYSAEFAEKNSELNKEIRWVIGISFDILNTDIYYFTSHNDCDVPPGVPPEKIIYSTVKKPIISAQNLDTRKVKFSLGNMSFELLDKDSVITDLLNSKLLGGSGLRRKRAQVWRGYKGLPWAEYQLAPGSTQLIDNKLSYRNGIYTIRCKDIQRTMQKIIFENKKTNLAARYTAGDISITVDKTSDFEMIAHGASYSDAPNATVGYIRMGDNVIRYTGKTSTTFAIDNNESILTSVVALGDDVVDIFDASEFRSVGHGNITDGTNTSYIRWTGKSGNQLTGVTGISAAFASTSSVYDAVGSGRFNTADINVDIDSGATVDRQPEIKEFIYLELPATKIAKALLTGTNPTLPSHWHLGIPSSFVATSRFDSIGTDLYDVSDDTSGFILRFSGLEKRDGKKFIEQQINLPQGCFMPVLADGQLGYKRMTGVLSGASPVAVLDGSNVIDYSQLDHDLALTQNVYRIIWNKLIGKKTPTRENVYVDTTSQQTHQSTEPLNLTFEGLHGARHTDAVIDGTFGVLRDRYSGPPELITVNCFDSLNGVEVGDIVWCDFKQRDFVGGGDLNRAFEVVGYRSTGDRVTLTLFGSSQDPGALPLSTVGTVMQDDFYSTAVGLLPANKFDVATTGSYTGLVWHVTSDSTFVGSSDMAAMSSVLWLDSDIVISPGVTLNLVGNVQLRYKGALTVDGNINLVAGGLAGQPPLASGCNQSPGIAGYIGATKAQGGFVVDYDLIPGASGFSFVLKDGLIRPCGFFTSTNAATAVNSVIPILNIVNNDGLSLSFLNNPIDMRGSSGGGGGNVMTEFALTVGAVGGAGGTGGSSCLAIGRGLSFGPSSKCFLGGERGEAGTVYGHGEYGSGISAGVGASGFPGCFYFLADGDTSNIPSISNFSASFLAPITRGQLVSTPTNVKNGGVFSAASIGLGGIDVTSGVVRTQYIPPSETPAEDVADSTTAPVGITVQEVTATKKGINIVALEISIAIPAATNYRGSMVYIKKSNSDSWQQVGEARGADEVIFYVPADGAVYDIKAHGISILGVEADDFYGPKRFTVSATQIAVIGAGNSLATSASVQVDGGVRVDTNGIDLFDVDGNQIFDANSNTGELIVGIVASEKYFKFDPVTGDLTLGRNAQFKGGDSYNNNSFYWRLIPESLSGLSKSSSGGGIYSLLNVSGELECLVNTLGVAQLYKSSIKTLSDLDWGNEVRFKCRTLYEDISGFGEIIGHIGIGDASTNIWFDFRSGGDLYGRVFRGSTVYSVSLGLSSQVYDVVIEIIKTSSDVSFYINGVLKGSITTALAIPISADGNVNRMFEINVESLLVGEAGRIAVSEWRYLQS